MQIYFSAYIEIVERKHFATNFERLLETKLFSEKPGCNFMFLTCVPKKDIAQKTDIKTMF